jgi:excisionase family DNA binding protein
MADDDILTVAQVAAHLHVTPQTVRAWIDSGKLRAGRVGKAYMILRRDVYAMLEQAAVEHRSRRESDAPPTPGNASKPAELWAGSRTGASLVPPRSG